jgi:hypothetical protein
VFGKAISYINNEKSEQVLQSKERVIRKREKVGKIQDQKPKDPV